MEDYIIDVTHIEELQMIKDLAGLEDILQKAKVNIVRGGKVVLVRTDRSGNQTSFDSFTNLDDFTAYRRNLLKYLL